MKKLTLLDGTVIELTDTSQKNHYVAVVKKWADIDSLNLITENLQGGTFEGEELTNTVFESVSASYDGENIVVTISCRNKTDLELLQESQEEQNAMINMLLETQVLDNIEEVTEEVPNEETTAEVSSEEEGVE